MKTLPYAFKKAFLLMILSFFIGLPAIGQDWKMNEDLKKVIAALKERVEKSSRMLFLLKDSLTSVQADKLPIEEMELTGRYLIDLETSLTQYDSLTVAAWHETAKKLRKEIDDWQAIAVDARSRDQEKQIKAVADMVNLKIQGSIDSLKQVTRLQEKINAETREKEEWKNKFVSLSLQTDQLSRYYQSLPTKAELEGVVQKQMKDQIAELREKKWGFSIGFMGAFNDRVQKADYFVNLDTMLVEREIKPTTTLNFGLLFGYYLGKKENISIGTSLPILSLVNQSGSSTLTTFMKRASGAIGIGISPCIIPRWKDDESLRKFVVQLMWNVANTTALTPGYSEIYLNGQKGNKFPGSPGETLDPISQEHKNFFRNELTNTLAVGIAIRL